MSHNYDLFYDTILKLVKEAGDMILENISKQKSISEKSCNIDLVTETDKKVEDFLVGNLLESFPNHKFIGEEQTVGKIPLTDDPTWIIDPIDGTMNFVHGFPHCCISIALFVNKIAEIGIIFNPNLNQLFTARRGHGCYLNNERIHVSSCSDLSHALISTEIGTSRDPAKIEVVQKNFQTLMPICHGIRSLGSCALNIAMVALGASDVYFEFGIHVWDIAAGILLVQEAGGVVVDPAGGPIDIMSRRILCANSQQLANELIDKLHQFYPTPVD